MGTCAAALEPGMYGQITIPVSAESTVFENFTEKEMAQHLVLVCQIMTTAIDTVPKARLCH
ncbi:MAG: hypothetical protein IJ242_05735 [Clostridia bacterium]|nr:hypothetical protein [Clostridia bacterium]